MDIVIDTSAIVAVLLREPERQRLVELTRGYSLCAPSSVAWEIGNAFSAMFRRERLSLEHAHMALKAFGEIPIRYLDVDIAGALTWSHELGIYAYDAYVIEAAVRQACPILTLDRGLRHAAREVRIEVLEV